MKQSLLVLSLFVSGAVFAQDELAEIKEGVRAAFDANLKATREEDLDATMATIHSESMIYEPTKTQSETIFRLYDLEYEIKSYKFVAFDGEYAYARVRQKSSKVSGFLLRDSEVEYLQVYKKEGDAWKIWSQVNLEIKYE